MLQSKRAEELSREMNFSSHRSTDRVFALLMVLQWIMCVSIALFVSPKSWSGEESAIHIHVWSALIMGGSITLFTGILAHSYPGKSGTRHLIAIAQMLMSGLIIHVSNGRLESHFHVFGSLAFLAFYRDPWVLITASGVTALDHILRGAYWPMSAYGEVAVSSWRWLEHAAWVIFEDVFLVYSCIKSNRAIDEISNRQASLEEVNSKIEAEIVARTAELEAQRERTLEGEKMAALGEMAAGMAHEINNPVAIIQLTAEQLQDVLSDEVPDLEMSRDMAKNIQTMGARIGKIVKSLKSFARDGEKDPMVATPIHQIVDETIVLCEEKFRNRGVELRYEKFPEHLNLSCRSVQISQIILNLLQNGLDAVEHLPERWVEISYSENAQGLNVMVTDSGGGIPESIREKILQPFFTTKEVGKGTGLGLSISKGIMEAHHGELQIDSHCPNTRFILNFKKESHGKVA